MTLAEKRKARRQRRNFICVLVIVLLLVTVGVASVFLVEKSKVQDVTIEAGNRIKASAFYKDGSESANFALDCPPFYIDIPGTYQVKVQDGIFPQTVTLRVEDTIDPIATPKNLQIAFGTELTPEDFLEDVQDATKLSISFATQPDYTKVEEQLVTICLRDLGGNETLVTGKLSMVPVHAQMELEAGCEPITVRDLVLYGDFVSSSLDLNEISFDHVGEYDTTVTVDGADYACHISVKDTVPPVLEVQDVTAFLGREQEMDAFVVSLSDVTEVTLSMSGVPDYTVPGETVFALTATDEGGNQVTKDVKLTVEEDTEAPVFVVAKDFDSFAGEQIAYRSYVTVEDNSGEEIDLQIDTSKVNRDVCGDYPVVYTATDYAGNVSTAEILVHIKERTYTDEDLYQRIDVLLSQIITDGMDETQKARAVYDWVKGSIAYTGSSDKTNFNKAAVEGLLDFKGDCYTNSAICVACFKRLGMDAMIVKKVPIVSMYRHWWLMVQVDGNWYHMDTCPRTWDKPEIFLWTETQLSEYSARNTETHNYDRSLYPAVTP